LPHAGFTHSLLRGDRGERVGKYLLLIEIESVETHNRSFPESGLILGSGAAV
jgi:hypothetical protein